MSKTKIDTPRVREFFSDKRAGRRVDQVLAQIVDQLNDFKATDSEQVGGAAGEDVVVQDDPITRLSARVLDNIEDGTDFKRLQVGVLADRPAAGTADRYYMAVDAGTNGNPILFRDTGSAWEQAAATDLADVLNALADNIDETAARKWAGETGADVTGDHAADVDALLTQNAPAEAGADVTLDHAGDLFVKSSTAPSHQDGRIWFDTDTNKFFRSNGSVWEQVTALDALQLVNAPAEAGADVTGDHAADVVFQGTEPSTPNVGVLWADPSTNPKTVKRWDGSEWQVVGTFTFDDNIVADEGDSHDEVINAINDGLVDEVLRTVRHRLGSGDGVVNFEPKVPGDEGGDPTSSSPHFSNAEMDNQSITDELGRAIGRFFAKGLEGDPDDADSVAESASRKWAGETGADVTGDHAADVDALLTQNAPAEAGADVTLDHAGDLFVKSSTAPSHQDGRIWFDTDTNKFFRSNGSVWEQVTALDALQLVNAPAEAGADVTGDHAADVVFQGTEPSTPNVGVLWADPSTNPKTVKRWDGSEWQVVGTFTFDDNIVADEGDSHDEVINAINDGLVDEVLRTVRHRLGSGDGVVNFEPKVPGDEGGDPTSSSPHFSNAEMDNQSITDELGRAIGRFFAKGLEGDPDDADSVAESASRKWAGETGADVTDTSLDDDQLGKNNLNFFWKKSSGGDTMIELGGVLASSPEASDLVFSVIRSDTELLENVFRIAGGATGGGPAVRSTIPIFVDNDPVLTEADLPIVTVEACLPEGNLL